MTAARIADYLAKWALETEGAPFETPASWLCFVRRGGTPAVLKLFKPHADEERSAAALAALGGPCVRVLGTDAHAVLLERCIPGTPLSSLVNAGKDDEATRILCDVIAALDANSAPLAGWPRLEDWGKAFGRIRGLASPALTPDLVDRAEAEFFELCATQADACLLHGDVHHENVLWDEARGWCVIDPKGVVGDRTYEVLTSLHNPIAHLDLSADPKVMTRRVETFAGRLGLDETRILRWTFAQSTLSAAWHLEDRSSEVEIAAAVRVARTAERLLSV